MIKTLGKAISALPIWRRRLFSVAILSLIFTVSVTAIAFNFNTVTVKDGENTYTVRTMRDDASYILSKAGITVADGDEVTYTGIDGGKGSIEISRAFDVSIVKGDELITVTMTGGTVLQAIEKAGIEYSTDDIVSLDVNAAVSGGMQITYDDVDFQYVTEEVEIAHDTTTEYSSSLKKGEVKTVSQGVNGIKSYTYLQKLVNGKIVESTVVEENIVKDAVGEKTLIGTKEEKATSTTDSKKEKAATTSNGVKTVSSLTPSSPIELDANGRPVNYKKLITGKATAYSPYDGSHTATGKAVRTGYVAVNPDVIPYGTELYIITADGSIVYGYAVAEDTGGFAKKGNVTVDLFFDTYAECISFGVRNVEIYVL